MFRVFHICVVAKSMGFTKVNAHVFLVNENPMEICDMKISRPLTILNLINIATPVLCSWAERSARGI